MQRKKNKTINCLRNV